MHKNFNVNIGDSVQLSYTNSPMMRVERILFDDKGERVYVCSWFSRSGIRKTEIIDEGLVSVFHHSNGSTTVPRLFNPSPSN